MKERIIRALAAVAVVTIALLFQPTRAQSENSVGDSHARIEQTIWKLLDDDKAVYVSLPEADFLALGEGFDLPDGGKAVTELALKAPGGAFDPRDVVKIPADKLGYKADWTDRRTLATGRGTPSPVFQTADPKYRA